MEQADDPFPGLLIILDFISQAPLDLSIYFGLAVLVLLLLISALISGSETAFFSLSSGQLDEIDLLNNKKSKRIISLLEKPKQLLATILIANNFINVAIVILSAYLIGFIFDFSQFPVIGFFFRSDHCHLCATIIGRDYT
ncbi:MAG: DUF21 domain-containing protein [Bacteroidales bacterium]|nr:DUF21 domain-containing protein [Bacteroidales bacterium]